MLARYSKDFQRQVSILITDDVVYMRAIIKEMLNKLGFDNITEAVDGHQALGLIKERQFSLVLCDWNMPRLTGIALLRTVRLSHSTITLPFLMVTSNKKLDDVKQCIDSGVSGFLVKPFNLDVLAKQLDELHDDIVLHQKTMGILSTDISDALNAQQAKPAAQTGALIDIPKQ